MTTRGWALLGAVLAMPTGVLCISQGVDENPVTIADNVRLVLLDVGVKSRHGEFVSGLQKINFSILDDGKPRDIQHFSEADEPVTLGLVVDNSGSMARKRPEVITAGLAFAKESNPHDEFFVVNFNDSVTRGLPASMPFTDNVQILRRALYFGRSQGETALYDAVAYALNHLEMGHYEKRTLVIVSDGRDNVSRISFEDLLSAIRASRATIYTVGLYDPDTHDLNPGALRKMAKVSGGEFFEPQELSQIVPTLHTIASEMRHRYTLTFLPSDNGSPRPVHAIKVVAESEGHKLTVHTRSEYSLAVTAVSSRQVGDEAAR